MVDRHLAVSCLLLLVATQGAFSQKKPVTLDDIGRGADGSGLATEIKWRPDSSGFSFKRGNQFYFYEVEGKRTRELPDCNKLCMEAVTVPDPPAFEWTNRNAREETTQWCSDNRHLLVKSNGDLFYMDSQENTVRQITKTLYDEADPKLSPDCKLIVFRKDYDLYSVRVDNGYIRTLTRGGTAERMNGRLDWVYPEELKLASAVWWSPDSQHIAFLQFDVSDEPVYPHADYLAEPPHPEPQRYPKAGDANAEVRLGIIDRISNKTRFVDLGPTRDYLLARVNWLPDGKRIAVQRLNRIQNDLKLIFVDVETLETEVILTEKDKHWVNVSDSFTFIPKMDAFLWTSENTGYRHLYLYYLKERYAKQLTEGTWEVTDVLGVHEEQDAVFVEGTKESPLERHIYSIPLSGGPPKRISAEEGSWSAIVSPDGDYWVARHNSLTKPTGQFVMTASGKRHDTLTERDGDDAAEFEILPTEFHTVLTDDGTELFASLIKPAGFDPSKKYPVIVQVYGGPHAQSVRNNWSGPSVDQVYAHNGFVVWQLDNRGTSGRGHVFETPVFRKLGVVELEDQLNGVEYLKKLGFVDEERIGVNGWSYGGFMTLNCLLNAPEVFKAGISGAPVVDWNYYDTIYTERYMDVPQENQEGYSLSSLLPNAGNLKASLLLVHNLWDDNVHFQNTLQLVDRLQKAGKQFQLMIYPQKAHGVRGEAAKHMRKMMLDFFERELKGE